jgi:hypothetical protein
MYVAICTEVDKADILYINENYRALAELVYLNEIESCVIFSIDNTVKSFLEGVKHLTSDRLYEMLLDLGGEFESDDKESWLDERIRLATLIMERIASRKITISEFELSAQVSWKDSHAKDKPCQYVPGKMKPKIRH